MAQLSFSLFGTSGPARSTRIDAGERHNVYAEQMTDGIAGKGYLVWYSRPGLESWLSIGAAPVRGWRVFGGFLYTVMGRNVYKIASDKGRQKIGEIASDSGYVSLSDDGTDVVIADGSNTGYRYQPVSNTFGTISGYPGGNTVAGIGGFVVTDGYRDRWIYTSAYRDAGTWYGESNTTESDLTPNKYVFSNADLIYICSATSIETWYVSGGSYPLAPAQGAAITYGLLSPTSVIPYLTGLTALVGGKGEIHLGVIIGYQFENISSQEVEREWATYGTVADATVSTFSSDAHPFLAVSFPLEGKSWLYDASSKSWARMGSGTNGSRWIGQYSIPFAGKTLISDYSAGTIYAVSLEAGADNGTPFACELVSQPVYMDGARFIVSSTELRMETGNAALPLSPEITLQMADCGTWKQSRSVSIGATGERWRRARLLQCGQYQDLTVKFRYSGTTRLVLERALMKASS